MTSDTNEGYAENEELLRRELRQHLQSGDCALDRQDGQVRLIIHPGKNRQVKDIYDTLEETYPHLKDEVIKDELKKTYRKRHQFVDPEKGPAAEVNQLTSKLTPRVSKEHVDRFNQCADSFGSKREALERAIELLEHEIDSFDP